MQKSVQATGNKEHWPKFIEYAMDYMVVAGGGGGNSVLGGGGGAGGFRESSGANTGCYSASPLGSGVTGLTLEAGCYSVTVGGGGNGASFPGGSSSAGSNSVFSTITSTGGEMVIQLEVLEVEHLQVLRVHHKLVIHLL